MIGVNWLYGNVPQDLARNVQILQKVCNAYGSNYVQAVFKASGG